MFTHLGWPQAPRFAARLLYLQAIAERYEELSVCEDAWVTSDIAALSATVFGIASNSSAHLDTPDAAPFQVLLDEVRKVAEVLGLSSPLARKIRDAFVAQLGQWQCGACSPGHVCAGRNAWADDRALAERGRCLLSLQRLFATAEEIAREQYPRPIPLKLVAGSALDERLGSQAPFYAISGTTASIAPDTRRLCVVVNPNSFDLAAFRSILFVFLHEAFVHGLAGIPPGDPQAVAADPFSEGWMDWLASKVLRDWADDARAKSEWSFALRAAFADSGEEYHAARMQLTKRYGTGAIAARRLARGMRLLELDPEKAWERFRKFSVELNSSPMSGSERGKLVRSVNACLLEVSTPSEEQRRAAAAAYRAIEAFLTGRPWSHLAEALVRGAEPLLAK